MKFVHVLFFFYLCIELLTLLNSISYDKLQESCSY